MYIYVAKSFTAVVGGSRVVDVRCDRCGVDYHYQLDRQGTGVANAHYYCFQDAAKARADRRAVKDLNRRLSREAEPVACPRCLWVNARSIALHRRLRHRWVTKAAWIAAIVVPIVTILSRYSTGKRIRDDEWPTLLATGFGVGLAIAATMLAIRWALRRRFDPNRTFPAPPTLPIGTPTGWIDGEEPAPRDEPAADEHVVVFHFGKLALPDVCCECLARATTTFRQPVKTGAPSDHVEPPLCDACAGRLRGAWWRLTLIVTAGALAIAGVAFLVVRPMSPRSIGWPIAAASVVMVVAWALGVVLISARHVRPHVLRIVDAARGIATIRFRNADYASLVRQAIEDSA